MGVIAPSFIETGVSNICDITPVITLYSIESSIIQEALPIETREKLVQIFAQCASNYPTMEISRKSPCIVSEVKHSVVCIKIGMSWASGVIVSRDGAIITNAHLIRPHLQSSTLKQKNVEKDKILLGLYPKLQQSFQIQVRIDFEENNYSVWHDAVVIFSSPSAIDVALLQIQPQTGVISPYLSSSPISSNSVSVNYRDCQIENGDHFHTFSPLTIPPFEDLVVIEGRKVYVFGYGMFGPSKNMAASVTLGSLCRIVPHPSKFSFPTKRSIKLGLKMTSDPLSEEIHAIWDKFPAMYQSSAVVVHGNSGGVLLNEQGKWIGLVTSNTQQKGRRNYARLNFSLPTPILQPLVDFSENPSGCCCCCCFCFALIFFNLNFSKCNSLVHRSKSFIHISERRFFISITMDFRSRCYDNTDPK